MKSEREREIAYDITYMWDLKYDPDDLFMKQKQAHKHGKDLWLPRWRGVVEGRSEILGLADVDYCI